MELNIDNIDLLLPKKVPKHGKVSGIKKDRGAVRVIIPNENTKLSLIVSEPSEVLVRNVTMDGKILGLSNFIDKKIYIVGQNIKDLEKETGMSSLFDDDEWDENARRALKKLLEESEKHNLDPNDLLEKLIEKVDKEEKK
jgi:hypothetical protein